MRSCCRRCRDERDTSTAVSGCCPTRLAFRVFLPAALLLFVSGTAMTLQASSFGQTWIAVSVALWVLSAVVGAVYLGPRVKRAAELFETEGPTSQAGRELIDRLFVVSRLELIGFAVIIALVTSEPGA